MEWKPDEIKALRKKLELSQREFAKQLGVKRQTVECWESSLRTPSKDCQVKINAVVQPLSPRLALERAVLPSPLNAVVQPLSPPGEVFRESSRNEVVTSKDYE